jgi:hypothetical protein
MLTEADPERVIEVIQAEQKDQEQMSWPALITLWGASLASGGACGALFHILPMINS